MFGVASGAVWSAGLGGVMNRAVVAGQARLAIRFSGKLGCFLDVAGGALAFEDGVRLRHAAATVNAGIFMNGIP